MPCRRRAGGCGLAVSPISAARPRPRRGLGFLGAHARRRQAALAAQHLAGQAHIGLRAGGAEVVEQDRLAVARRLGDADVAGDDGLVDLVAEEAARVGGDQVGEVVAAVEHGQHDPLQHQRRVEAAFDDVDRAHELADALEREELALKRHQHGIGGDQGVQSEQAEAGRTIDEDEGVGRMVRCVGAQGVAKTKFAAALCRPVRSRRQPDRARLEQRRDWASRSGA